MKYEITDNKEEESACGMRVKFAFTFTGAGQMSTPYVTETGLITRNLPPKSCPSGILPELIPGLCMERSKDPSCNKVGYAVFLITYV
eukprot:13731519-Ditylum_brightwellii.AAC.1